MDKADKLRARNIFDSLDVFGTGNLVVESMRDLLIDMGYTSVVVDLISSLDFDKDGRITFDEFYEGYQKFEKLKATFSVQPATQPSLSDIDLPLTKFPTRFADGVIRTVSSTDNVLTAVKKILDAGVRAIPVVTEEEAPKLIGLLDCADVVAFLANTVFRSDDHDISATEITTDERLKDVLLSTTAKDLTNYSGWNPLKTVRQSERLRAAAELMCEYGVRRVPVLDQGGRMVNIVSQLQVVAFLRHNIELLASGDPKVAIAKRKVTDMEQWTDRNHALAALELTCPVLHAVWAIAAARVTSVAIVDSGGAVQGGLSCKDICRMLAESPNLNLFTKAIKDTSVMMGRERHVRKKFVTAKATVTLQDVAQRFVDSGFEFHALWVLDNKQKPIERVTLLDILPFALDITRWG